MESSEYCPAIFSQYSSILFGKGKHVKELIFRIMILYFVVVAQNMILLQQSEEYLLSLAARQINQIIRDLIRSILITSMNTTSDHNK